MALRKLKKKRKEKYIKIKDLQKSALAAIEKCIGPKIVSLNLKLKENLFQETPSRGPPRSPSTKTGENSIFSFKPSISGSAAVDIPTLFLDPMKLMSSI